MPNPPNGDSPTTVDLTPTLAMLDHVVAQVDQTMEQTSFGEAEREQALTIRAAIATSIRHLAQIAEGGAPSGDSDRADEIVSEIKRLLHEFYGVVGALPSEDG